MSRFVSLSRSILIALLMLAGLCGQAPIAQAQTLKFTPSPTTSTPGSLAFTAAPQTPLAQITALQAQEASLLATLQATQAAEATAQSGQAAALAQVAVLSTQITALQAQMQAPANSFGTSYANSTGKLVLAHYLLANFDYGPDATGQSGSQAGYEQDIRDAKAVGVDGFVLDFGAWTTGYQTSMAHLFAAANAVGGFKVALCPDLSGSLSAANIVAAMTAHATDPAYFAYQGRPFLAAYAGNGGGFAATKSFWGSSVLAALRAQSPAINPYFCPYWTCTNSDGSSVYTFPTQTQINAMISGELVGLVDGFQSTFAPIEPLDPNRQALNCAEAWASTLRAASIAVMGSVSPQYWGVKQIPGRRYYEADGGEGIAAQWNSLLSVQQPAFVTLVTWNDFDEATYFSPAPANVYVASLYRYAVPGFYKPRLGAGKENGYFVQWWKTGSAPSIATDSLAYYYRTQPAAMVAMGDAAGPVINIFAPGNVIPDDIFITTWLTAPATLVWTSNYISTSPITVPTGYQHTRIPFTAGFQSFALSRNGAEILAGVTDLIPITPDVYYNYNYTTGFFGH